MIKHRIGKPYVRRLKKSDTPVTTQAKCASEYLESNKSILANDPMYTIGMRGTNEVFLVSPFKRQLVKVMRDTLLD
ncbi:hypothetical protein [Providencia rettgeri]|uniref:hypothetical protein n=1 Tax=Providencia rettgeri TaxID=587 RepID=UPI002573A398|nr:hypothetical protein [Providencia rettgeri]MDL9989495.1 hypothetical protein [Providencia rettgeri]